MSGPLIVTPTSHKGGVGKSTVAALIASAAGRAGLRVLIVDTDPTASLSLALDIPTRSGAVAALLGGGVLDLAHASDVGSGVAILPGGVDVEAVEVDTKAARKALRSVPCDLVVIDTPPSPASAVRAGADLADVVVGVCAAHAMDVAGATRVLSGVTGKQRSALVVNRLDRHRQRDRDAAGLLRAAVGVPVFEVPMDERAAGALNDRRLPSTGRALAAVGELVAWIQEAREATA